MEKVLNDFANMAGIIVERIILSTPGPDSPLYWIMLGTLLALLALLVIWLVIRLRRAGKARVQPASGKPEITFDDVTAQARAEAKTDSELDGGDRLAGVSAPFATAPHGADPAGDGTLQPATGFKFFKKRSKSEADGTPSTDPEDDVFLLGLEQEMLATRQLYLDGLISKEVYVTETRALYDKAQTRMT